METKGKKKFNLNFDLLQKLGKVLMTVIAVMPAAGLMISIGKLVQMAGADLSIVMTIGSTMENIGWAVINNLHILFAVAIGGSWAKERAGGAFAALISFILINQITGSIFGVTSDMLNDATAVTHTLFGKEILVNGYFTSVLGVPALNMGVFVGIIAGFAGGIGKTHNCGTCGAITGGVFALGLLSEGDDAKTARLAAELFNHFKEKLGDVECNKLKSHANLTPCDLCCLVAGRKIYEMMEREGLVKHPYSCHNHSAE